MHHKSHGEQGCGEIDDWDRHEHRDQESGEKNCALVCLPQAFGLRDRRMTHGGQLEIFAAKQIGAGQEKNDRAGAGEKKERHRDEVDQDRQQSRLGTFEQRARERQRRADRLRRIVRAFDFERDLIDEEAADQRSDRRHQEH